MFAQPDLIASVCTMQNLIKYHMHGLELPHGISTETK